MVKAVKNQHLSREEDFLRLNEKPINQVNVNINGRFRSCILCQRVFGFMVHWATFIGMTRSLEIVLFVHPGPQKAPTYRSGIVKGGGIKGGGGVRKTCWVQLRLPQESVQQKANRRVFLLQLSQCFHFMNVILVIAWKGLVQHSADLNFLNS